MTTLAILSLPQAVMDAAVRFGDAPAIVVNDQRLSFSELERRVVRGRRP